jgi:tripartite-type tricarboxylate transporter receptor subunit TctC
MAPTGTPQAIIDRLRTEVNAVLAQPEVAQRLLATGAGEPSVTTLEEFAAIIRRDHVRFVDVIRRIGLKVD